MIAHYKYITEAVWLPTYIGVAIVIVASVSNGTLASALVVVALIVCRMLLEVLYRITFGDARLQLRTQLAAFWSQVVLWGLMWAWHAQRTAAA